jgi:hypothetical protein
MRQYDLLLEALVLDEEPNQRTGTSAGLVRRLVAGVFGLACAR